MKLKSVKLIIPVMMKRTILLFMIAGLTAHCWSQTGGNTDILTERVVDRPLTLHAGQLQINPGYQLSIGSRKFDADGDKIDLASEGTAMVQHLYNLEIKYGILEFVEVSAALNYSSLGVREKQVWYFHGAETMYTTQLTECKGLSNLFVGLALRLPFDIDHFGWRVSAGASLPVANYKPEKPTHSSTTVVDSLGVFQQVRFHYNDKAGNGTMIYHFGTTAQFFTDNMAITGWADYSLCFSEAETHYWESRLYEDEFSYQSVPYKTKPGNTLSYVLTFDYQAIDWFDVFGRFSGMMYNGGWDEEEGVRIGHPEKNMMAVGFGYEIQVARHLRLFQSMDIPILGKNELAPLVIYTGASFNFLTR